MAYSTGFDIVSPGRRQTEAVAVVCRQFGFSIDRFRRVTVNHDIGQVCTEYKFEFNPVPMPQNVWNAMEKMSVLIDDAFIGPVVRASVPEFSSAFDELRHQVKQASSSQSVRLTHDEILKLMEQT